MLMSCEEFKRYWNTVLEKIKSAELDIKGLEAKQSLVSKGVTLKKLLNISILQFTYSNHVHYSPVLSDM